MNTGADEHSCDADALLKQAWAWLRVLNAGEVKAWDAEGFKRWLQTSPAHQAAFNEARQRWTVLRPLAGELLRTDAQAARRHERAMRTSSGMDRRLFLGAALGAAAVAGVVVVNAPGGMVAAPETWGADFRTATGEQRTVALTQGVVMLNTRTSIRRMQASRSEGFDLLGGEAAVDLAGDAPFTVVAGAGRSTASAGRFEVRYIEDKVCVTCIEGAVQVEHRAGARTLRARQQTRYDESAIGGIAAIDPATVSAWRKGALMFDDTRLVAVIEEINRYRPGRVVLMNDRLRDAPVSGNFFIASLDQALVQLQHTFGLRARALPAGLLILS